METKIEYRVRPVTRYVVTRYEQEYDPTGRCESSGRSTQHGEFDNAETAYAVGYALCKAEHDRLGYPPGDERISYPKDPGAQMNLNAGVFNPAILAQRLAVD
jgi:hypothetical protein